MNYRTAVLLGLLFISLICIAQDPSTTTPPADSTTLIIVAAPKPFYPTNVDPKTVNGDVLVRLHVTEKGDVESIEFLSGDPVLKDAAMESARNWKFKPFIRGGVAVPVATKVTIQFQEFPKRIRVSQGVLQGLRTKAVPPEYPRDARTAGIQGSVVLHVIIDKEGNVKETKAISGDSRLVDAADAAVRQWKYKPYLLNGEPIEVDSMVTVNFTLGMR